MQNSSLLTVPQAAAVLGVSRSTIYRLIDSGALETLQIRGCRRIRPVQIERFIDAQQRTYRERAAGLS